MHRRARNSKHYKCTNSIFNVTTNCSRKYKQISLEISRSVSIFMSFKGKKKKPSSSLTESERDKFQARGNHERFHSGDANVTRNEFLLTTAETRLLKHPPQIAIEWKFVNCEIIVRACARGINFDYFRSLIKVFTFKRSTKQNIKPEF